METEKILGSNYIIYGPPWRVVQCAKNGNVKIIERESGKDCCVVVEDGDHKSDFVEDDLLETMLHRCRIDEERLVPVQLVDKVTMEDGSFWINEVKLMKHQKREFTRKGTFEILQGIMFFVFFSCFRVKVNIIFSLFLLPNIYY
jgi:hypothetical protein